MRRKLVIPLVWLAAVLLGIETGGGLFEHLVLDQAWPENLALIQPEQGGVNRGTFWIPVHSLLSLVLLAALWASWPERPLRRRVAWVLGLHFALRVWSFAYFIPAAIRFEAATGTTRGAPDATAWIIQSPLRTLVTFVAFALLFPPRSVAAPRPEANP